MTPAVLSLDLGTRCGWALAARGRLWYGTADLSPLPHWGDGGRFLLFKRFLHTTKHNAGGSLDHVIYEHVNAHRGTKAAQIWGGWWAILTYWCEHHGIPYQGVSPNTLKKEVAGHGHASKSDMMAAVEKTLDIKPRNDDEGDALAGLIYFRRKLWPDLRAA